MLNRADLRGRLLFHVFAAMVVSPALPAFAQGPVVVQVDRSSSQAVSHFNIGVTFTGREWENGDPAAVRRAKKLLATGIRYMNQHITIWGVDDPEPKPGVYNWASLDTDMELIRSLDGTPIITLCCAPGWMNRTHSEEPRRLGPMSWEDPGRVTDDHLNDYANLSKSVALRYPDVNYFQVWNELKDYWDPSLNDYDYKRYTTFYNVVYDEVKSARPDAKLGGPYYPQPDYDPSRPGPPGDQKNKTWIAIDYRLKNKHGADFVNFDGWIAGYPPPPIRSASDEARMMTLTDYFGKNADQLRARTDLPVWVSEMYCVWRSNNPQFAAASFASCSLHALLSGVYVGLLWGPNSLFTSTRTAEGGEPTPQYRVVKVFNTDFGPGTQLYKTTSSSSDVEVLASATKTLLINKRNEEVMVQLDGNDLTMTPYEVRLVDALRK